MISRSIFRHHRRNIVSSLFNPKVQHHHERRLLNYTQDQLYKVVAETSEYPKFVPWCKASKTLKKVGNQEECELTVGFNLLSDSYLSLVTFNPPHSVKAESANTAMFSTLQTVWSFEPGPTNDSAYIIFDIHFQFRSALYQQASSVFFDEVVHKMVSAFETRSIELYGESGSKGGSTNVDGIIGAGASVGSSDPVVKEEKKETLPPLPHQERGEDQGSGGAKANKDGDILKYVKVKREWSLDKLL